jgi:hypothetical protein
MSVMQKLNIAALVTGLLALGWYLVRVLPQLGGDVAAIAWQWPMAISLLAFIVMITVAGLVASEIVKALTKLIDYRRGV